MSRVDPISAQKHERFATVERFAPLSGLLAMVLWVIAVQMLDRSESSRLGDSSTANASQITDYLKHATSTIYLGTILFGVGAVAFIWFLSIVRERLTDLRGGFGSWAFASGLLAVATMFGFFAVRLAAAMALESDGARISDQAVEALYRGTDGFFIMALFALGGFFLATGIGSLGSRALPAWFAWLTIVLGAVSLVPWVGWVAEFLLPVWVLVVCIYFVRSDPAMARRQVGT
jgi:hypothetical protein